MLMDDDVDFGPHTALLPVSGLQEEKKRKHHALLPPPPSHHLPSSSLNSPRSTLLTQLSELIPLPSSATATSSPSPPTPSPTYLSHTISHYHAYLASLPPLSPHPPPRLSSLTSQLSTLILLHHLSPPSPSPTPAATPPLPSLFSSRHATLNLLSSSPTLTRSLSTLDWLEDLAHSHSSLYEAAGAVSWKRTLRRMQVGGEGGGLGVDSELVGGGGVRWEEGDREDSEVLLRYVWTFMRAGSVQDAVQLCIDFKQPWRAASIGGGQLWHNEGGEGGESAGHRRHFLFKQACRKLAGCAQVGSYERAVYGLLGSDVRAVLGVSQTWEDCVWAMLRVSVDREIDAMLSKGLKDDSERQLAHAIATPPLSLAQIFERIAQGDDSIPAAAAQSASSLYHHLQRLLVLSQYDQAEAFITDQVQVRSNPHDTDLIPFAVHLYLYFHPQGPGVPLNDNGRTLFLAYIEQLQQSGLHHLVPLYTAYLSHSDQVLHYSAFLRRLPTVAERIHYLHLAQQYFPSTVLRITTVLVQGLIEEEREDDASSYWDDERPTEGGVRGVSSIDRERIASLDCFGVSSTSEAAAVLEAMRLSNLLFRTLLRRGRLHAAKLLSDSLLTAKLDQFIAMEKADETSGESAAVDARREVEAEHGGWVLYMKATNWLAAWSSKLAIKPQPPQPIQASAARTAQQESSDRARWRKDLAKHEGEVAQWKKGWDEVSTSTIDALLACLQQDGCGWMKRAGAEADEWRRRLIPSLLFLLHRVCSVSERGVECLQMAELVVDERYRLYECMDLEERRALMVKLKDSYAQFVLQPHEDQLRTINHSQSTEEAAQPPQPSPLDAPAPQSKAETEREEEDAQEIEEEERKEERVEEKERQGEEEEDDAEHPLPDEDEMAAADAAEHKYDEEERSAEEVGEELPPAAQSAQLEELVDMEEDSHEAEGEHAQPEQVETKEEQLPAEVEELPSEEGTADASADEVVAQVDSDGAPPLSPVLEEPSVEPAAPEPLVEAASMDEAASYRPQPQVDADIALAPSPPASQPLPPPPQDEETAEPFNPPVITASAEADSPSPALLPRLSPSPVPLNPFQEDLAVEPPVLPAVVEERGEEERLPSEPRRSSRPRRGPSLARSVKEEEEELRPPARGLSIEEEPSSPASSVAESITSTDGMERKASRSRSRRRMSKPVEPSTRVLRTRK